MASRKPPTEPSDPKSPEGSEAPRARPLEDDITAADLPLTVSLQDDEEAQLAHFDRFLQADSDLIPTSFGQETASSPHEPAISVALGDNLTKNRVNALATDYPSYDRDSLTAVLHSCDGDVDAARRMLNDSMPSSSVSRPRTSRQTPDFANSTTNAAENSGHPSSQENDTSSDATLAIFLQGQEAAVLSRRRRLDVVVPLHDEAMARLMSSLREIVVPALKAHFAELVLPDSRETSGSFKYELRNLQVAALSLPADNVNVRPAADNRSVLVSVVDAHLELEVGHWSYETQTLVPIRDSGRARATIHGLCVSIRLVPRRAHSGGTRIRIEQCDVTVDGVVRFKTQGAAADWAYNTIAMLFKPWVVSYVKDAVADAVEHALSVHLRQLEIASRLDDRALRNGNVSLNHASTAHDSQAPVSALE